MPYNPFDDTKPDGLDDGVQVITDIKANQQAMRDMIILGLMVGWSGVPSGGSADMPAVITYTKGLELIKKELTWGTGAAEDLLVQTVCSHSADSGNNYNTIGTYTITYDVDGNWTGSTWS